MCIVYHILYTSGCVFLGFRLHSSGSRRTAPEHTGTHARDLDQLCDSCTNGALRGACSLGFDLTPPDLAGPHRRRQERTREIWINFATVTQIEHFGVRVLWVSTLLLRISPDRPGAHRNARARFGSVLRQLRTWSTSGCVFLWFRPYPEAPITE